MKPNRSQRRRNREARRAEYKALCVAFILQGGHKDWIVPFNFTSWRNLMQQQIADVENGNVSLTQPRNIRYDYSSNPPGWRTVTT